MGMRAISMGTAPARAGARCSPAFLPNLTESWSGGTESPKKSADITMFEIVFNFYTRIKIKYYFRNENLGLIEGDTERYGLTFVTLARV